MTVIFENPNFDEDGIIGICEYCDNEIVDGDEHYPTEDGKAIMCQSCCFGEEQNYENDMLCPYCKHAQSDPQELMSDDGTTDCGNCNREFNYEKHFKVTYSTKPILRN